MPAYAQISCGGLSVSSSCLRNPAQSYKCIDGDYDAPSLYGTLLLTPAQAQSNPQYILVKGKVTFSEDYTFAEGSNIVFLDNGSGFRVESPAELNLENTDLNGCTKLWAGIEVLPLGRLKARQCTFEDAKAAIILRDASTIEATANVFRKNYCGIVGVRSDNPLLTSSILLAGASGISDNIFYGNDQLLETVPPAPVVVGLTQWIPEHSTNRPYAGIWLERVRALTIGHLSDDENAPINRFQDFGQHVVPEGWSTVVAFGIKAAQTNLTVKNCQFENMGVYIPESPLQVMAITNWAAAIFAANFTPQMNQTIIQGLAQGTMFRNCFNDVFTQGTDLTVNKVSSWRAFVSIIATTTIIPQAPIKVIIADSKIDYFRQIGIWIGYSKPITIQIEKNVIADNDELSDLAERYGILLDGSWPEIAFKGNARIYDNQIKARSKSSEGLFYGIGISRSSYLKIEQNKIIDEDSPSNLNSFFGIATLQSPANGLLIRNNNIKGAGIQYPGQAFGILLEESVNSTFVCNYTNNLNTGIAFTRNCDNTDLRKNDFNYLGIGLSVGHPSFPFSVLNQIGLQQNKENRWISNNSPIDAFALNEASALASIFRINSTNMNSVFWPLPRKIGPVDDPGIWFLPSTVEPPAMGSECFIEGPEPLIPGLTDKDEDIINGVYQEPWGFPAMDWEARWHFSDRLNRSEALRNLNAQVAAYYHDKYQHSYSSLNRLYQSYLNRWRPEHILTEQLDNDQERWRDAVAARFSMDAMLSASSDNNGDMHILMLQADGILQAWADTLQATSTSLNDYVNQQVAANLAELENVSTQYVYEQDMKGVLRILMQTHGQEGQLSTGQTAELSGIAAKCRYSGGYAVVLARGMFEPQSDYPQDGNCQMPQLQANGGIVNAAEDAVEVFPNPAGEYVNLSVKEPFERGVARIYNVQGVLMDTYALEGAFTQVPLGKWLQGMYLIEVLLDGKPVIRKKIIKMN